MITKAVEIKDLGYCYPDGTKALDGLNLDVFEGESAGIIGSNGAGKSTLLLHLNGILKGTGHIKIFDFEINDKNLNLIRKNVGLVFQDPDNQLFMPTVFDDVSFGPINMLLEKDEVKKAAEYALKRVDMIESINRSSHHLSFGEKKRVSIATVLSMNPKILVLDEPTSNLDPKHRRQLIDFLRGLSITKIVATHDLALVKEICTKVVLLDRGRLIKYGDVSDILCDKVLLREYDLES